jgi:Flp pilus assembly protein TadB
MAQKRRPEGNKKTPTPLDEKARALAETQAKIEAEIARQQQVIQEAPQRAKEIQQRRRDELINRASRTEARPGSRTALPDRRFSELNLAMPPMRQRGLRAERRRGRLMFFVLFVTLCGLVWWLYHTVTHP